MILTLHPVKATIIGQLALLIWAMAASGVVALQGLPVFEILSALFICGFIASASINTIRGNWRLVFSRPRYLIIAGILGVIGNDIFYILAFKSAPAAQVDLIACLWPMMVLILASVFLEEGVKIRHIFACMLAFLGVSILLTSDTSIDMRMEYLFGYFCAFLSAVLWSVYIVISKKYVKFTPELFAVYCAVGSVFSVSMHVVFETTIIPTSSQWIILIVMGVSTHSLAYYSWDFAIKRGHFKLLNIGFVRKPRSLLNRT